MACCASSNFHFISTSFYVIVNVAVIGLKLICFHFLLCTCYITIGLFLRCVVFEDGAIVDFLSDF